MAIRKTKNSKVKVPPFAMLPRAMIQSPGYRSLSFVARCVLVELLAQYSGDNNGDLSATRTMAKDWGISSDNTLRKALIELESAGWILLSRSSLFNRHGARCALYAVAWQAIDECPGKNLEVAPTRAPPRPLSSLFNSISSGAQNAHVTAQQMRT